jgi:hypothetical protein
MTEFAGTERDEQFAWVFTQLRQIAIINKGRLSRFRGGATPNSSRCHCSKFALRRR